MSGTGSATVDFGAFPGANEASVAVTGEAGILAGSHVEAFMMAEASSSYTAGDHTFAPIFIKLTCGNILPGTGFTIYATSQEQMEGTFSVRWVWV